ncbi:hypothetical protein BH24CHL7_BH24CHL7_13540 [soil metagenome]
MAQQHEWQFFAVSNEGSIRAVVICTRCGDSRWETVSAGGGQPVMPGGECTGERAEPEPSSGTSFHRIG